MPFTGGHMYTCFENNRQNDTVSVSNIPFRIIRENNTPATLVNGGCTTLPFSGRYQSICFLGMCCAGDRMSEWWGQNETAYDHTSRIFFGDRLGKILVIYEDFTQDLVPLLFGVNVWNYNLYYEAGNPYDMPFSTDPEAKKLLDDALLLYENKDESATRGEKYVFAVATNPEKTVKCVEFRVESAKSAGIYISAFTGISDNSLLPEGLMPTSPLYYIKKEYFPALDRLARRLYQFRDEIPESDPKLDIPNFGGPDIEFGGCGLADIYTNIYRANLHDMMTGKVSEDGMPHTSTSHAPNYGCYFGFGTFKLGGPYSSQVWTRDAGRTLTELTNYGCGERLKITADLLHEMLYQYAIRYKIPHWKRIANIRPNDDNDIHNEGKENDGHGAIMMFISALSRKNVVDKEWLLERRQQLVDAAEFFVWQVEHPKESNFIGVLCSESEASTQLYGGHDLFSNAMAITALEGYCAIFRKIGDDAYADKLAAVSKRLQKGCHEIFMTDHPRYGRVYTDVSEDCWTYLYKRFAPLFLHCDVLGYDVYQTNPAFHDAMTRSFLAQKEEFYNPMSGRQMGYGQGYLTQTALLLDLPDEANDCVEAATMLTYHHTDWKYIVPEGVITHGDGRYWFRNSDLGNGVQQAEIVKLARIMIGVDDFDCERGIQLIPRLPKNWQYLSVKDFPTANGKTVSYRYSRTPEAGAWQITDGKQSYYLTVAPESEVKTVRVGPFETADITADMPIRNVVSIQNRYYAYLDLNS